MNSVPGGKSDNGSAPDVPLADVMAARDELVVQMREDSTWQPMFGPLLDEVATALQTAARLRAAAEEEPFAKSARTGRSYAHPAISLADVEVRRAAMLLQRVVSMAGPPQPAEGEPEELDPFAQLDAYDREDVRIRPQIDESPRRASAKPISKRGKRP